jgi:phosphoenolpyruvate carboxykinase (ATP)
MNRLGKDAKSLIDSIGIDTSGEIGWNLSPKNLVEDTLSRGQGTISDSDALSIRTGEFTGRSPKDRFIVIDEETEESVWWGDINIKISSDNFDRLMQKAQTYLSDKDIWAREAWACADPEYRISIRIVSETPWSNMFAHNMFIRPTSIEMESFDPEWHVVCVPGMKADPEKDGTRQENFAVISFSKKTILIGGTGYTGEIKKGIFSVLNYLLPKRGVLPMHCSANIGDDGDSAIFFGLSGTGKTTLSSDPARKLIGDDEHGWSESGIFNFEGGCYAKTIGLSREKEPQIYDAIRFGALLENVKLNEDASVDYSDSGITENTRVSYPISHIENAASPSQGPKPTHVFFLTADAFGVLPPISRLTKEQAMYHFMSGYTAKVAGTEMGVDEPQAAFSACFGKAFLPLHPAKYAEMLGEKLESGNISTWLVNTGWTGGPYGVGTRMKLEYTRAMISAAMTGKLENVEYSIMEPFGIEFPTSCDGVPAESLNPRSTWEDKQLYDETALQLARRFSKNFEQFESEATIEIVSAGPRI